MTAGTCDAGWSGTTYPTADFSGPVGYTRKDVRIDHVLPSGHKPGGSISTGFVEVPADGWSQIWTAPVRSRSLRRHSLSPAPHGRKFRLLLASSDGGGDLYPTTVIDAFTTASLRTVTGTLAITKSAPGDYTSTPLYLKVQWVPNNGDKQCFKAFVV